MNPGAFFGNVALFTLVVAVLYFPHKVWLNAQGYWGVWYSRRLVVLIVVPFVLLMLLRLGVIWSLILAAPFWVAVLAEYAGYTPRIAYQLKALVGAKAVKMAALMLYVVTLSLYAYAQLLSVYGGAL